MMVGTKTMGGPIRIIHYLLLITRFLIGNALTINGAIMAMTGYRNMPLETWVMGVL